MTAKRLALRVGGCVLLACGTVLTTSCRKDRDMAEQMEMPDTTMIMEAMDDEDMRDSLLDVMPGGEMARGDSAAAMRLLRMKLGERAEP